jgi:hypothetical protein
VKRNCDQSIATGAGPWRTLCLRRKQRAVDKRVVMTKPPPKPEAVHNANRIQTETAR